MCFLLVTFSKRLFGAPWTGVLAGLPDYCTPFAPEDLALPAKKSVACLGLVIQMKRRN